MPAVTLKRIANHGDRVIRHEWVCVFDGKAVIFHTSVVYFTWTRGDMALVAAGHDYSLFGPFVFPTSLL